MTVNGGEPPGYLSMEDVFNKEDAENIRDLARDIRGKNYWLHLIDDDVVHAEGDTTKVHTSVLARFLEDYAAHVEAGDG